MKLALTHVSLNLFLEREKHIRDSVLPSKQRNNAFLSLSLVCVLGKQGNPKNCIQNQGSIINLQGFAAIWHLTFWLHGDLEPENLAKREDKEYTPCVSQIHDFTSTFLFSVETQHTIGIVVEIGKCCDWCDISQGTDRAEARMSAGTPFYFSASSPSWG